MKRHAVQATQEEDQAGCKRKIMHAEDEHKPAAQAKQQENNRKIPAQKDGGGGKETKRATRLNTRQTRET